MYQFDENYPPLFGEGSCFLHLIQMTIKPSVKSWKELAVRNGLLRVASSTMILQAHYTSYLAGYPQYSSPPILGDLGAADCNSVQAGNG